MNSVNITYQNLLYENGLDEEEGSDNYKQYLNKFIQENVQNVKFVKNTHAYRPEHICSEKAQGQALDQAIHEDGPINLKYMSEVAKYIRREILHSKKWIFQGSFDDFTTPPMLSTLLIWILTGTSANIENVTRRTAVDRSILIASQIIL